MQRTSCAALVAGLTCFALALSDATAFATYPGANGRVAYVAADGSGIHTILPSGKGDQAIGVGGFPSWSADGQRIAFIRELHFNPDTGGNSEIFSMAADGSDVQRLTYRPGDDIAPFYSPNGRRIVFTGVQGIMTMRSDGSDLRLLTSTGGSYGWSPNGEWILYIVGRTGDTKPSIWEMRPDGSDKHRLVFLGSDGGFFSDYSPDGKSIHLRPLVLPIEQNVRRESGWEQPSPPALLTTFSGWDLLTERTVASRWGRPIL